MIRKIILSLMMVCTVVGCTNKEVVSDESKELEYTSIEQDKAKEMMDNEDVIILDVRTEEEYNSGYIKDAMLLPLSDIEDKAEDLFKDKKEKILVYCRSGNRSKEASKVLVKLGYENIYEFGGINTWGYEVETIE
ncbi:MAG: rhodanese-like domain-containing protein [Clostridia bacterium]|jgi:rhodanese-related sulfurtransferase|nr:rhodanese-like domain-containing protein [Clostridia bacterium]